MSHVDINSSENDQIEESYNPDQIISKSNIGTNVSVLEAGSNDRFSTNLHLHHIISNTGQKHNKVGSSQSGFSRKSEHGATGKIGKIQKIGAYQPMINETNLEEDEDDDHLDLAEMDMSVALSQQSYDPDTDGNVLMAAANESVFEAQDDRFSTNLHRHHILSNSGSRHKNQNEKEIGNKFRKSDYSANTPAKKVSYQPKLESMKEVSVRKSKNGLPVPNKSATRASTVSTRSGKSTGAPNRASTMSNNVASQRTSKSMRQSIGIIPLRQSLAGVSAAQRQSVQQQIFEILACQIRTGEDYVLQAKSMEVLHKTRNSKISVHTAMSNVGGQLQDAKDKYVNMPSHNEHEDSETSETILDESHVESDDSQASNESNSHESSYSDEDHDDEDNELTHSEGSSEILHQDSEGEMEKFQNQTYRPDYCPSNLSNDQKISITRVSQAVIYNSALAAGAVNTKTRTSVSQALAGQRQIEKSTKDRKNSLFVFDDIQIYDYGKMSRPSISRQMPLMIQKEVSNISGNSNEEVISRKPSRAPSTVRQSIAFAPLKRVASDPNIGRTEAAMIILPSIDIRELLNESYQSTAIDGLGISPVLNLPNFNMLGSELQNAKSSTSNILEKGSKISRGSKVNKSMSKTSRGSNSSKRSKRKTSQRKRSSSRNNDEGGQGANSRRGTRFDRTESVKQSILNRQNNKNLMPDNSVNNKSGKNSPNVDLEAQNGDPRKSSEVRKSTASQGRWSAFSFNRTSSMSQRFSQNVNPNSRVPSYSRQSNLSTRLSKLTSYNGVSGLSYNIENQNNVIASRRKNIKLIFFVISCLAVVICPLSIVNDNFKTSFITIKTIGGLFLAFLLLLNWQHIMNYSQGALIFDNDGYGMHSGMNQVGPNSYNHAHGGHQYHGHYNHGPNNSMSHVSMGSNAHYGQHNHMGQGVHNNNKKHHGIRNVGSTTSVQSVSRSAAHDADHGRKIKNNKKIGKAQSSTSIRR